MLKSMTAALCLAAAAASPALAQDEAEREAVALELVQITQVAEISHQMLEALEPTLGPSLQRNYPDADEAQIEEGIQIFREEMTEALSGITDFAVKLYAERFTLAELQAARDFYETPEGARMIELLPGIMQESQQYGMQQGMQAGVRAQPRIEEIFAPAN